MEELVSHTIGMDIHWTSKHHRDAHEEISNGVSPGFMFVEPEG